MWRNLSYWNFWFWSNVFFICKCIFYSIHHALGKNTNLKKLGLRIKYAVQKIPSFFFRELQLITVLLLIWHSYMSWSTRFVSLKLGLGFSIFDSVPFLLKFIFLFNKIHRLFKTSPFKMKIIEKLHTVLLPDLWFLSCKKKFWKLHNICVSWSSPKLTWWWTF